MTISTVLFYFAALGLGVGTILWALHFTRRYPYDFLLPLRHFQVALAVYGFVFFVGQICILQVMDQTSSAFYVTQQIIAALAAPAWSVFVYFLWAWGATLVGLRRPRWLKIAFWCLQVLLAAVALGGYIFFVRRGDIASDLRLSAVLGHFYNGMIFAALLCLVPGFRRLAEPVQRRLARNLGVLYIAGFLAPYLISLGLLPLPGGLAAFWIVIFATFFGVSLPPFAYLTLYLRRHRLPVPMPAATPESIEAALAAFELTQREAEIVPLIAAGLTNDEIAERLFIASKTVKNNISSIYRKMGMRNRVELTNCLRRQMERSPAD